MNYYTTIRKEKVEKIKNFIDSVVPIETWADNIILSYIGGKICYNKDFNVRNFEFHNEEVYTFLKKLSKNDHLSVFEHDMVTLDLMDYVTTAKKFSFTIMDIFSYIVDDQKKFLEFIPDSYTSFPVYSNVPKHVSMVNDVFCKLMGTILNENTIGSAKCGDKIAINLRSYLEICKVLNCEDEFWDKIQESQVIKPTIVDSIELKNGGFLHIIRVENGQLQTVTFMVEGGSIVLEKQLIRHRYQTSHSVSSFRYNTAENSQFVMPLTEYQDKFDKEKYQELVEMYGVICSSSLDVYKNLTDNGIKKEDARFVIPVGVCTNIMCTMTDIGLKNFLEIRTDKTSQWEINEIATRIESVLNNE